jgi:hypothetical protein
MATILVDGVAIEANEVICDPLPGDKEARRISLQLRGPRKELPRVDGRVVPVVFPLGGRFYRGAFQLVSSMRQPDGTASCTFVSDGEVAEYVDHRWYRPFTRLLKRRHTPKDGDVVE